MIYNEIVNNRNAASERRTVGGEQASESGQGSFGPLGLSKVHIRPFENKYGSISYFPDSHLITLKTPWLNTCTNRQPTKRGEINGFSKGSRKRMMNMVAKIRNDTLPIFVTLTYPKLFPTAKQSKRDLKVFLQRIKRKWPDAGGVWKLEYQRRGAPHYHMLLYGVPFHEALSAISEMWFYVVGSGDLKHLVAGTRVEKIINHRGVMSYASKYIGKIDTGENEPCGRVWGYFGNIPFSDEVKIVINRVMAVKLLRALCRYIEIDNRSIRSFYVGKAERWLECHEGLSGDIVPF